MVESALTLLHTTIDTFIPHMAPRMHWHLNRAMYTVIDKGVIRYPFSNQVTLERFKKVAIPR